ncbi:tetratricopeptide repeat protein [Streptomyces sp. SP18BB07]|uniref:tetratricopeptide repeat protein n=1 Tax=Streptomyces sp. SP18BB07 TaxID=3002522 RepID=UPI002E797CE3|nr:tetratricopeptide repeat protein [Streptomyces sp. SP18BB07]MEE1763204.1 tetratricopeptide repeat protein [Streptomyces sp. SP18BB07]
MSDEQPREQRNEGQGTFVSGSLHGGVWNIFVNHVSQNERQPPSAQEMLALGSVEAPFGRLPHAVLGRDGILTALTQRMDDPRIQVLSGMGGVGKTTVALSSAERAKQAGAEVFWIQAGSAAAVADGMRRAALLAGAPAEHVAHAWEKGGRPAADLVWRHLANMDRPWLLVFDDADDLDVVSCPGAALADATGWVRPPVGKSYGVLVTTRDGNKRSWGDRIARFHQLDVLETKFAGQVLQELAPEAGGTDSARSLADRLGSLPLALHLAGTYLAMAHGDPLAEAQTFTQYLRVLDDSPLFLDDAAEGMHGDLRSEEERARRTIAGTWELSLALLERQGTEHARGLLQLLSCFAPAASLPASLLSPSTIAELGMWPKDLAPRAIRTALGGLRRFGLIGVDTLSEEPVYQIHRLVAEVSVAPLLAEPSEYRAVWDSAADLLVAATPYRENPRDPSSWPAWQGLIPHWTVMMRRLPRWSTPADDRLNGVLIGAGVAVSYLHFRSDYTTSCALADEALERADSAEAAPWIGLNIRRHRAVAIEMMGDLRTAESELAYIVEECAKQFGAADPTTLAVRFQQARVTCQRGKLQEAECEYDEVIRHETRLFGATAATTLRSRHARAICIRSMGRLDEAAAEGRQVLDGLREELGEKHPDVLEAHHEFAISLRDQGENERAEEVFRQVLELEEEILGIEHPSTLITRANLASTLILRQEFTEAETEIRAVLDARTRILGPNHPETLDARHTLAVLLTQQGELDANSAAAVFAELTDAQKRQLVDDHPNVLAGRKSHAAALRSLGELVHSESEYKAILDAATTCHGEHHPVALNARFEWAKSLGHVGRTDDAVLEMRNVLALQEDVLGKSHRNVASVRASLGALLLQQGRLAEAEGQLRQALNALPEDDGTRLDVRHDLVAVLHARGRLREAIHQLQEIADQERRSLGPAHPNTINAHNSLGVALKDFGRLDEAVAIYREALRDAACKHSADQPLVLTLRHNLAVAVRIQGNLDEAEKEHSAILKIQERRHGPEHSETLSARLSLARILEDRGAVAEAESAYREILSACTRRLGRDHRQTLSVWGNLAFLLADQERFIESETEYREALIACQEALGDDHPKTLTMNHNLAMVLGHQGNFTEAVSRLSDVVERRERTLGRDHPETLTTRENLGEGLSRVGRPAASADQFKELAEGWARIRGEDDDSVWDARYRRAQLLWEADQPRAAQNELEALLNEALEARADGDPRITALQRVLMAVRADDGNS